MSQTFSLPLVSSPANHHLKVECRIDGSQISKTQTKSRLNFLSLELPRCHVIDERSNQKCLLITSMRNRSGVARRKHFGIRNGPGITSQCLRQESVSRILPKLRMSYLPEVKQRPTCSHTFGRFKLTERDTAISIF